MAAPDGGEGPDDGSGEPDDEGREGSDESARPTGGDEGGRVFTSDAARRAAAVRAAALVGVVLLLTAGLRVAVPEVTDPTWVRARVEAFGPLAPAAFVALQATQVVVAPVPGQLLGGVAGLFVLFLLPAFPDDLLCFAVGLSDVRLRTLLALVVLGRTPSFLAVAYAGDRLGGGRPAAFAAAVALLGVLSLVAFLARDRIARALDRAI